MHFFVKIILLLITIFTFYISPTIMELKVVGMNSNQSPNQSFSSLDLQAKARELCLSPKQTPNLHNLKLSTADVLYTYTTADVVYTYSHW